MFSHVLHALTLAITVVVVAVPEGLPMMITVVLSSNMRRMLKDHVLVRKLVGIETSGSLNILFTDKTGTLTRGTAAGRAIYRPAAARPSPARTAANPGGKRCCAGLAASALCCYNNQASAVCRRAGHWAATPPTGPC